MSESMPLAELLVPTVAATVPVTIAAGVMRRRCLDSLLVLDHGEVCGVLTDQDLLRTVAWRHEVADVSVAEVCRRQLPELITPNPLLLDDETDVADAARRMLEGEVGSAVTVADEAVTGVVTGHDLAASAGDGKAHQLKVGDVSRQVAPLSPDDGLERAVELLGVTRGRPVPVVEGDQPVGTVQIGVSPTRAAPADADPAAPLASAPTVVRRPWGGSRFFTGRGHAPNAPA